MSEQTDEQTDNEIIELDLEDLDIKVRDLHDEEMLARPVTTTGH